VQLPTIDALLRARADDDAPGLLFEDRRWSWREVVAASAQRAAYLAEHRQPGPLHVGLLLDNVPDFAFWLGAAALAGGAVVGINPTRRGADLARDIRHTDCQWLVTERRYLPLLEGLDHGLAPDRVLVVDDEAYADALAPHAGAPLPDSGIDPLGIYLLIFTSGTTGAPKAVICSQARLAFIAQHLRDRYELDGDDTCYIAMPLFHSNALMAGWAPALHGGSTIALRRRFSASGFLEDVRRFGVTFFNYVGKPLAYILATPERPDDADTTLRNVFGNEATEKDIEAFGRRFGCTVVDGYGSSEGGATVQRTPDMPRGALGVADAQHAVLDPETGEECPPARFDARGRLQNAEEAIGELVNRAGGQQFEGYYKNDEANRQRVRDGAYWTGDLAYRDEKGFFYFAGRDSDWLRVDGENFAVAPVERLLLSHPDVVVAAVYAVPDVTVGDQVMAALVLRPGVRFDAEAFRRWLEEQPDLGTKWMPRYLRVSESLPSTASNKVLKRQLQVERWHGPDPVWHRGEDGRFTRLDDAGRDAIRRAFAERGREHLVGG